MIEKKLPQLFGENNALNEIDALAYLLKSHFVEQMGIDDGVISLLITDRPYFRQRTLCLLTTQVKQNFAIAVERNSLGETQVNLALLTIPRNILDKRSFERVLNSIRVNPEIHLKRPGVQLEFTTGEIPHSVYQLNLQTTV